VPSEENSPADPTLENLVCLLLEHWGRRWRRRANGRIDESCKLALELIKKLAAVDWRKKSSQTSFEAATKIEKLVGEPLLKGLTLLDGEIEVAMSASSREWTCASRKRDSAEGHKRT